MSDIYTTRMLNGVVDRLPRLSGFILQMFFPMLVEETSEEIHFDVMDDKPRLAPFVSPLMEGKVVQDLGFKTKSFKPAYIKDKRIHIPDRALRRAAGEQLDGNMSPEQRAQINIAASLADQQKMVERRLEHMAVDALLDGKVTVDGDGFDSVEVDFGRDATHTVTLTGGDRWGETGVKPLDDIETWAETVFENSGAGVTDIVMDPEAWKLFRANQDVKDLLDTRRGSTSSAELGPSIPTAMGVFKGTIGEFTFWTYGGRYTDSAGTSKKILPDNTVMLGSSFIEGVQHFGAIRDNESLQARRTFSKSWLKADPSVRYLLTQSAPLMVPYRPDASFTATVR